MRAVKHTIYGPPDVLHMVEMDKPEPNEKEILVRLRATSVNYGDLAARNFKAITPSKFNMPMLFWILAKLYFGLNKPKSGILGSEFSGEVEATGAKVIKFQKGDQVFGYLGQSMGAYAEYFCIPENGVITIKPANISHEEAAVLSYGSIMANYLLGKAGIQPGWNVLINGASGSIGSAAVQIAKNLGAHVTGVCSTSSLEFVKSLGADEVIDYKKEDFTKNEKTYDLIFDVLGRLPFSKSKTSLNSGGILFYTSFKLKHLTQMLLTKLTGGKQVYCTIAPGGLNDLETVTNMIKEGKINTVIDKQFPLQEAAAAHQYAESGRKGGKIVITV